jgi:cytochrome c biogenesis factor
MIWGASEGSLVLLVAVMTLVGWAVRVVEGGVLVRDRVGRMVVLFTDVHVVS